MDALPPELWSHIFALACQDDGTTGRALSAVSKFTRAASCGYRFASVAIRSDKQLAAFLRTGITVSDHSSIRVVHLYIHVDSAVITEFDPSLAEPLETLLTFVANTLRSLTMCFRHSIPWYTWLGFMPFLPALEDLAVVWELLHAGQASLTAASGRRLHDLPTMKQPQLRRLHVCSPNRLQFFFGYFPAGPRPQLTHWRVSISMERAYVKNVSNYLLNERLGTTCTEFKLWERCITRLPGGSTHRFELYAFSPRGSQPDRNIEKAWLLGFEKARRAGGQVPDVFRAHHVRGTYGAQEAYEHWLDVVTGGDGCWTTKSDVISDILL